MRLTLQHRQFDLQPAAHGDGDARRPSTSTDRFAGAAMTFCNEIAARWQADRVGLGFLKGRYVQLKALSHTEKFSRKMKLVQDIEAAMEECLDQDVEIIYPPAAGGDLRQPGRGGTVQRARPACGAEPAAAPGRARQSPC